MGRSIATTCSWVQSTFSWLWDDVHGPNPSLLVLLVSFLLVVFVTPCTPHPATHCTSCRQELVTGKATPTHEDLQDWEDSGSHHDAAGGSSIKGVPYYYLTVLCNQVPRSQPLPACCIALALCGSCKGDHATLIQSRAVASHASHCADKQLPICMALLASRGWQEP